MDDLNILHIQSEAVLALGHGVTLESQADIPSKTMVCFLDSDSNFHYGFCYKHNPLRAVCWEANKRSNKSLPRGALVIAFREESTAKSMTDNFDANDFNIPWFDNDVKVEVKEELLALQAAKKGKVDEIVNGLCDLTLPELDQVINKIKELKNI